MQACLALLILFAAAAPVAGETPAELRQRILASLADEIGAEERPGTQVVVSGGLAAVRPGSRVELAVYLLERDPGDAERWRPVTRITASGEAHFGDALILGSDTLLVAAPDVAGTGLGPGMAYVFQRHVGGRDGWGLVARLAPAPYPPPGAVVVRQLASAAVAETPEPAARAEARPVEAVAAEPPEPVAEAPAEAAAEPPEPVAETPAEDAPAEAAAEPPEPVAEVEAEDAPAPEPVAEVEAEDAPAPEPVAEAAVAETPEPVAEAQAEDHPVEAAAEPEPAVEPGADLRFIVVANMREKPRALKLSSSLRDKGYPSEVYLNADGFFVVTLARLPPAEAQRKRDEAVVAGDVPPDAYFLVGTGFRERIHP